MSGDEHWAEADRLITPVETSRHSGAGWSSVGRQMPSDREIQRAHVHALLAIASAIAGQR